MGDALIATAEMGENSSAGRIGQGGKGAVQRARGILNHLVKCYYEGFRHANTFFQGLVVYSNSLIAPATATIGHAEIASSAPKIRASIAKSQ